MNKWLTCKRCNLHRTRRNVVLGRGIIPADILFIGEGPGKSENLTGEAFCGPSGNILNDGFKDAQRMAKIKSIPTYYITNLVACRPTDTITGKNRKPTAAEITACWPRLKETYLLVKPVSVVFIGGLAKLYLARAFPGAYNIYHPAYIGRRGRKQAPEYMKWIRDISIIFTDIR